MKLSILVAIYNVAPYLAKCVDSILNQTYRDFELILVDDGSTDFSGELCDQFMQKDSRVRVIHKKNGGLVSARQAGMQAAVGEYVGFVDGDDWLDPTMYEKLMQKIIDDSSDAVVCKCVEEYPGWSVLESPCDEVVRRLGVCYSYALVDKVFKREEVFKYVMNVDSKITLGEDGGVTIPFCAANMRCSFVDEGLYHYRINLKSISHAYDENLPFRVSCLINYLSEEKEIFDLRIEDNEALRQYFYKLIMEMVKNEANNPSFREMKQNIRAIVENKQWGEIISRTKNPLSKKFNCLLDSALKRKKYFMCFCLMYAWRMHMWIKYHK